MSWSNCRNEAQPAKSTHTCRFVVTDDATPLIPAMQATTFTPVARRFVWKEYRTLRGMWLAVVALGMITQVLSVVFAVPGANVPSIMFGTALGATILYAIGASAVMFSVEHEDET